MIRNRVSLIISVITSLRPRGSALIFGLVAMCVYVCIISLSGGIRIRLIMRHIRRTCIVRKTRDSLILIISNRIRIRSRIVRRVRRSARTTLNHNRRTAIILNTHEQISICVRIRTRMCIRIIIRARNMIWLTQCMRSNIGTCNRIGVIRCVMIRYVCVTSVCKLVSVVHYTTCVVANIRPRARMCMYARANTRVAG